MKKFFIGKKIGMTQLVDEEGVVTPVTVLSADPCLVVDTQEAKDGMVTVVLGVGSVNHKRLNRCGTGFFKKKGIEPRAYLKGFRTELASGFSVGQEVGADVFAPADLVSVRSKTIGRGFTGTIKRHNFSRGPMAHGSKSHRIPGSIGAGTTPGRVFKGLRMAGHYGDEFVTVKNLRVVRVDLEGKLIFLAGAVPGKNGYVEIFS
ncbi:50S ribosomal protein L3 [bacterium]|nr:50S ribosomal protein L3 [bacterium]